MKILTMKKSICLVMLLMCYSPMSNAANILAVFTLGSPSIHIWQSALVVALANRGHNVTVLSPEAQKQPVPNLTNLEVKELYSEVIEGYSLEEMTETSLLEWVDTMFVFFERGCEITQRSEVFQKLLNYPPDFKFDLALVEPVGVECLLGILPKFGNPPIVCSNSFVAPPWVLELTGTPNVPSHIPHFFYPFTDRMTFTERLQNFLVNVYGYYVYHYKYLPAMDKSAAEFFRQPLPHGYDVLKNVSVVLSNFHPTLDYPQPISPNLIPIAGIQIKDAKPLPTDIQEFLDGATNGAIYFSLGSNVRSDKLTAEKKKAILDVFSQLPQRVLWKFESDLPNAPKNVKIGKWLPQPDILAHPNLKLFITHAGLHSTHEAVDRAVPMIGIPFLLDQHTNIAKIMHQGCGVRLEYKDLRRDTLLAAINEVIGNSSYKENIAALSRRFKDEPQTPLERAVFWTEYVLRHQGAPHLRSAARDLSFIQYYLLDVFAYMLFVPPLAILVSYFVLLLLCKKHSKKVSKRKQN